MEFTLPDKAKGHLKLANVEIVKEGCMSHLVISVYIAALSFPLVFLVRLSFNVFRIFKCPSKTGHL